MAELNPATGLENVDSLEVDGVSRNRGLDDLFGENLKEMVRRVETYFDAFVLLRAR